jgi:hypothetical protein
MISALPNIPFTKILNEMGINDATGSLAVWQTRIMTYIGVLAAQYPSQPIIQMGFTPYTTADNSQWTTAAGQTYVVSHDWPTGFTQQIQNYLATLPTGISKFIFVEDYFDNRNGGGTEGKWRSDFSKVNTTLQNSPGSGTNSIQLRGTVPLGAALAIDSGNANAQTVTVTAVSGVGLVTATVFPTMSVARTAGQTVKGVGAQDGLHPSSEMAQYVGDLLAPLKQYYFV